MATLLAAVAVAIALTAWLARDVLVDHGRVLRDLARRDEMTVPGVPDAEDDLSRSR